MNMNQNTKQVTFEQIKQDPDIRTYIKKADESLIALGFTEHSFAHVGLVAENSRYILETLGYPAREVELAQIAGYLHDIGNLVNRIDHSQSGAVMAFRILDHMHLPAQEIAEIVTAIGNHDEGTGRPVSPMAAALILADKSDVRRSRVRNQDKSTFDIHDRVNYAVTDQTLKINTEKKVISLNLQIDTDICSMYEYFEIFLQRMLMCRGAADMLGATFKLTANGAKVL